VFCLLSLFALVNFLADVVTFSFLLKPGYFFPMLDFSSSSLLTPSFPVPRFALFFLPRIIF